MSPEERAAKIRALEMRLIGPGTWPKDVAKYMFHPTKEETKTMSNLTKREHLAGMMMQCIYHGPTDADQLAFLAKHACMAADTLLGELDTSDAADETMISDIENLLGEDDD